MTEKTLIEQLAEGLVNISHPRIFNRSESHRLERERLLTLFKAKLEAAFREVAVQVTSGLATIPSLNEDKLVGFDADIAVKVAKSFRKAGITLTEEKA